jgi:hypothetical protein
MSTLKSQAEAREQAAQIEDLRKRAARQAAKELANPVPEKTVEVTVLPLGDGKISMGVHIGGIGEAFHEESEKLTVPLKTALDLYEKGFVNFEGAKAALEERKARREAAAQRAYDLMDPEERAAIFTGAQ